MLKNKMCNFALKLGHKMCDFILKLAHKMCLAHIKTI